MFHLIGLAGRARSGKDTAARFLLQHSDVSSYALADPVKMACQALFGLSHDETWSDSHKEQTIALWNRSPRQFFQLVGTEWMRAERPDHWIRRAEQLLRREATTVPDTDSPLAMAMQAIYGMTASTPYCDFWQMSYAQASERLLSLCTQSYPDYMERRAQRAVLQSQYRYPDANKADCVIIRDIRYENEAQFIRDSGGQIWHIHRAQAQAVHPHSSELGISQQAGDAQVQNNGTLQELQQQLERLWQEFRQTHPKP